MNVEYWKNVVGYEGLYMVSNLGRIKSLSRRTNRGEGRGFSQSKEIILKPNLTENGYYLVGIYLLGSVKYFKVSRLVAIAFIPNPENKSQVNHINGVKTDDRVENLEWSTQSENIKHAYANGLMCRKGERHHLGKLTNIMVIEIRERLTNGESCGIIAKDYYVSRQTISGIKAGRTWKDVINKSG